MLGLSIWPGARALDVEMDWGQGFSLPVDITLEPKRLAIACCQLLDVKLYI
jgi:hypothetical protein